MNGNSADTRTRTKTGMVMALVVCFVLLFSHVYWLLQCAVVFLSFLGLRELYRAVNLDGTMGIVFLSLTLTATLAFLPSSGYLNAISVFFPVYVIMCLSLMLFVNKLEGVTICYSVVIGACIALFFHAATELRSMERGFYLLTTPILTCTITDVAAYFTGRRFGKRKLAPKISPKKTIAGFVGGTVAAVIVLLLAALVLDAVGILQVQFGKMTVYLVLTSIIGQFGDLALSAVKRICGIKDFASYFPGHGGVLDRCDSHLAALPFTYLFVSYAGPFL